MHRVTGTFADPSYESAFAAQLFRMAYPAHVVLLALVLIDYCWSTLVQPDQWPLVKKESFGNAQQESFLLYLRSSAARYFIAPARATRCEPSGLAPGFGRFCWY